MKLLSVRFFTNLLTVIKEVHTGLSWREHRSLRVFSSNNNWNHKDKFLSVMSMSRYDSLRQKQARLTVNGTDIYIQGLAD